MSLRMPQNGDELARVGVMAELILIKPRCIVKVGRVGWVQPSLANQ